MQLKEILRFRRDRGGDVPIEVLRQLRLPMPDDVLEQFVADHGTKGEFQEQYGELDLHALGWRLADLSAREVLAASIYPEFTDWTDTVSDRTRAVSREGWDDVLLPPGAAEHWQRHSTWMRPPVALRGDLVRSDRRIHLVEGHTRHGALRGLVETGVVGEDGLHAVWIGEPAPPPADDGPWRDVLKKEHMPFLKWLMRQLDGPKNLRIVASRLIDAQYASMSRRRVHGEDLAAVLAFAQEDATLAPLLPVIHRAHRQWARFIEG